MTTTKVLTFAFALFALIGLVGFQPAAAHYEDAGCTPGFWKNNAKKNDGDQWPHSDSLGTIRPDDLLTDFGVVNTNGLDITGMTFLDALQLKGGSDLAGKEQIFLRAAAAAILNAYYPDSELNYPISSAEILDIVNGVLATDNPGLITYAAGVLDDYNNAGCPLNNSGK
jgi:hypothetical protein